MALGYSACFDMVIPDDQVKGVVREEFEQLEDLLLQYDVSFYNLIEAYVLGDSVLDIAGLPVEDEAEKALIEALEAILDAFKNKTGITLGVNIHNQEEVGDIYDEVDGAFFFLEFYSVFQLTPEARKLQDQGISFKMKYYVNFG